MARRDDELAVLEAAGGEPVQGSGRRTPVAARPPARSVLARTPQAGGGVATPTPVLAPTNLTGPAAGLAVPPSMVGAEPSASPVWGFGRAVGQFGQDVNAGVAGLAGLARQTAGLIERTVPRDFNGQKPSDIVGGVVNDFVGGVRERVAGPQPAAAPVGVAAGLALAPEGEPAATSAAPQPQPVTVTGRGRFQNPILDDGTGGVREMTPEELQRRAKMDPIDSGITVQTQRPAANGLATAPTDSNDRILQRMNEEYLGGLDPGLMMTPEQRAEGVRMLQLNWANQEQLARQAAPSASPASGGISRDEYNLIDKTARDLQKEARDRALAGGASQEEKDNLDNFTYWKARVAEQRVDAPAPPANTTSSRRTPPYELPDFTPSENTAAAGRDEATVQERLAKLVEHDPDYAKTANRQLIAAGMEPQFEEAAAEGEDGGGAGPANVDELWAKYQKVGRAGMTRQELAVLASLGLLGSPGVKGVAQQLVERSFG